MAMIVAATTSQTLAQSQTYYRTTPTYTYSTATSTSTAPATIPLTRIESARQSADQFRMIARSAVPVVAQIASENAEFADQWADVASTNDGLAQRVRDANEKLASTQYDFNDVNAKLTHYGLTPTIGLLLQHKREQLDARQVQDSRTIFTSDELKRSRQQQLELEMVRYDGSDPVGQTAKLIAEAGYAANNAAPVNVVSQLQRLLDQRHQWLTSLNLSYQDSQNRLGELDSATTSSAKLTNDYRELIARHVIWIRSGEPISFRDAGKLSPGLSALFNSRRSEDIGFTLQRKWRADPVSGLGLFATVLSIMFFRLIGRSWLVGIGSRNHMKDSSAGSRKAAAGVLTTMMGFAIPGILYAVARWLGMGIVSESTLHASSGLYAAALVSLVVEVPRQLLRNNGYMQRHVAVELPKRQRAFQYLTLIGFGLVLASYIITISGLMDRGVWHDSLSRFGFVIVMLLVTWTAHLALRPTGGLVEPLIAKFGGSVIHRIRLVIYLVGIGFPLGMIVLSSLGYGSTANEFIERAIVTLVGGLVAATLWSGMKIGSARAWQMLTGSTPPPQQSDQYGVIEAPSDVGVLGEHSLELKHHLAFLCQCALVVGAIVCVGQLWIDVFPDVRMGNPVVWSVQDSVTRASFDASGQAVTETVLETTPITAFHLLMAAATLFVAFQLAKLLPAMFDALVLQRVSFDEGMEHLSLVLGRCLLFGIGCFIACKWIGVRWEAIQWLAVGLTIGLGFGLQDMVRNLFGGIIVLFEKPARLGDLISVGKITGRVASQKLRTTVLSDDDGREVIIPNKNFVSEEVVHWMGAGRLNVIPIEVAVTRDERPADLCRMLYELVIEQPDVLLTPAPQATLVCVGKRSQRIEVRAWIEDGQDATRFRDSLHQIVIKFLTEKNWLAGTQPTQPSIREVGGLEAGTRERSGRNSGSVFRSPGSGNRNRSA